MVHMNLARMRAKEQAVSPSRVREVLEYFSDLGTFRWRYRPSAGAVGQGWNGMHAGKQAGYYRPDGYLQVKVDDFAFLGHRAAWAYVYGAWPENRIDHINLNRSDTRIVNLREATDTENLYNRPVQISSKTGLKGVVPYKGKWRAKITHDGKCYHLGKFNTPDAAHEAYCIAAVRLHGQFARFA